MKREISVRKTEAVLVGSCNGCAAHDLVYDITLGYIGFRLCRECYRIMRRQINMLEKG